MSSFPRPLFAVSSAVASSSSARYLPPSTAALAARPFASTPRRTKSFNETQQEIQATELRAKEEAEKLKKIRVQHQEAWKQNPNAILAQLQTIPLDNLLYMNGRPFLEARKEPVYGLFAFLQAKFASFMHSIAPRSVEFGFPVTTDQWFIGGYNAHWVAIKTSFGVGPVAVQQKAFLDNLTAVYTEFRQAELKGDVERITQLSEMPVRSKTLRDLRIKPRSPRVAAGKWEIVRHVKPPQLISLFRHDIVIDFTFSHCLVRFNTVQQITVPPAPSAEPAGEPVVRTTQLVENVLFERRDWVGLTTKQIDTRTLPGAELPAPWKVKALVAYDDIVDVGDASKKISKREMEGFGAN